MAIGEIRIQLQRTFNLGYNRGKLDGHDAAFEQGRALGRRDMEDFGLD